MKTSELVSALADGQLDGDELAQALHSAALDSSVLSSWNSYHLIGDMLRSSASAALPVTVSADLAFLDRFNKRLQQEESAPLSTAVVYGDSAVTVIGWNVSGVADSALTPQLAQATAPQVIVASPQGPMLRDPRLEELLAAHQQLGGTSALQEPSGFLRNAIFDKPQDARR